jgi:hypothetical protein
MSIETLVRDELRGPVADLVRRLVPELVAEELARLNGGPALAADHRPRDASRTADAPPTLRCRTCGEERSPGRTECNRCRARRRRTEAQTRRRNDDPDGGVSRPVVGGLTLHDLAASQERTSPTAVESLRLVLRDEVGRGRALLDERGVYTLVPAAFPPASSTASPRSALSRTATRRDSEKNAGLAPAGDSLVGPVTVEAAQTLCRPV